MTSAWNEDRCYTFRQSEIDTERSELLERQRKEWNVLHDIFNSGLNLLAKHQNLKLTDAYMTLTGKIATTLTRIQEGERASYSLYEYVPSDTEIKNMSNKELEACICGKILRKTVEGT